MPRLQDALAALTKRHDMLRARFTELDGEPVMIVEDDSVSVPTLPTLIERGEVDSDRRIDLSIPPLFIPVLEQPGDGGFVLRLRTHHIVADAIALRVLLDELWALYNGTALLPATQFHDFAYRESGDVKVEAFWQERFADGVPCLRLPEDYLRPPALLKGAGRVEAWLDGDADAALTREAAKAGCSRFQWLVAAWAVLLNALSASEDDIIVGVPFAGRDSPETQACVGMFVRTLPLRLRLERDGTFAELLPVVRNAFLDAWNNQACPLERMAQLVRPPRLPGRNPFFDVMVNHVPLPRPLPDVPGLEIETLGQDAPEALFDLILDIRDERDGTALAVRYARDLFAHETAERWLDMLCGIVRKSVREPATLIRNIVPGAREQTARVREVWPETCTETEPDAEAEEVPDAKEKRKILMAAWRDQLGRDPETPEDNFFHSGGDSLKAIRMESRLRAAGWVLFAPDMFLKPGFGAMLAAMRREDAPAPDYAASENDDGASPDVLDLFTSEWSGDDD